MKLNLTKAAAVAWTLCVLAVPAQAQDMPQVSPALKNMLQNLPIADLRDDVRKLVGTLKKTSCGGGLTGCYATKSGDMQLYFFTGGTAQQTFLLVLDKKMKLPPLLKPNVQKVLGSTELTDPIISISTADFALDTVKMPADLQKIVRDSYFNASGLEFAAGVQLAARANLGGAFSLSLQSMGIKTDQLTMRAAVVMPIPTDLVGAAGTGAGLADAMRHSETMKKAGADALMPGAFVEFQLGPNSSTQMGLPKMVMTDMTFFIDNELMFGYKGNARFSGTSKTMLLQFQTPLTPEGAIDLLDFSFRQATPATITLEDVARIAVANRLDAELAGFPGAKTALARYGGGFIGNIKQYADPLLAAAKPLSVFQLANPHPAPQYKVGDPSKPFPTDDAAFNVYLYGPLAAGGPAMHMAHDVRILGQNMGRMDITAGPDGFHGTVSENISIKLGPLGNTRIKMTAKADIGAKQQDVSLVGNLAGQKLSLVLKGEKLTIDFSASCVNPFEIKASVAIAESMNIADIMQGQGGVNVDPSKIQGCIGKDLEAAYKKISGEYKQLGGYTAKEADAALKSIADEYDRVKDAARDAANKSTSAAVKAFNDAGNAFKKLGKKKKHHAQPPDPHFAASVFDWDYFYDQNPDLVAKKVDLHDYWRDTGFKSGMRGSREFDIKYYRDRYLDVQERCTANDYECILKHWLERGFEAGRQGSPEVAVADYLKRQSDLQKLYGREGYVDAMEHWLNYGEDEGRNAWPGSGAKGPIYGPELIGGDGGALWTDIDTCAGQYVTGFRLSAGDSLSTVQFQYGTNGWGSEHGWGFKGSKPQVEVVLDKGDYIVKVDYNEGKLVNALVFHTKNGKKYGRFGEKGGTSGTYQASPGERLACMAGRASAGVDRLIFTSSGLR